MFSTRFMQRGYKEEASTVTLRVVGGDKKESLKTETIKYGPESQVTRTREWPVLSSERTPHINKPATVWQESRSGRKPQVGALFQDRLADWPSVVI
jgi:hypothetical protein